MRIGTRRVKIHFSGLNNVRQNERGPPKLGLRPPVGFLRGDGFSYRHNTDESQSLVYGNIPDLVFKVHRLNNIHTNKLLPIPGD